MICDTKSLETMLDYIRWGASCFATQGLFFGHGTDNALDESVALVLHALKLRHDLPPMYLQSRVTKQERDAIEALFKRRIMERVPVPYLTNQVMFAGYSFYVDERALVPRSPIAELIEKRFQPWIQADRVNRILDVCTGSGCIGIASAHKFPQATVDLLDISPQALELAWENISQHGLEERVHTIKSDLFKYVDKNRYDIIISNPPYVSTGEMQELPREYQHEPTLGLEAGNDGLDIVIPLLRLAPSYLKPDGIIVVEVGLSADALQQRYPQVPFLWLEFEHGGEGVFILTAGQLSQYQAFFREGG